MYIFKLVIYDIFDAMFMCCLKKKKTEPREKRGVRKLPYSMFISFNIICGRLPVFINIYCTGVLSFFCYDAFRGQGREV